MPKVSVIITTKNEEANIGNCLESIKSQSYSDFEVVLVDNHSADRTREIGARYTDKIFDRGPERSSQRNFGVSQAKGTYILYLDADMILSKSLIEECLYEMEKDPSLAGLYVPEKIIGQGFWIKVRDFERSFYDGTVIDAVRFVPKAIFIAIGGFDIGLCGPEDWDFDKKIRAKGKVMTIKSHLCHNERSLQLLKYLKKKSYYAQDFDLYVQRWGNRDPDIRRQFGTYYRFLGVFVENGKFWRLLSHPILAAGMYFLRFCVGVAYVLRQSKLNVTASP